MEKTASELLRQLLSENGRKGGKSKSKAKVEAGKANIAKALAARLAKHKPLVLPSEV